MTRLRRAPREVYRVYRADEFLACQTEDLLGQASGAEQRDARLRDAPERRAGHGAIAACALFAALSAVAAAAFVVVPSHRLRRRGATRMAADARGHRVNVPRASLNAEVGRVRLAGELRSRPSAPHRLHSGFAALAARTGRAAPSKGDAAKRPRFSDGTIVGAAAARPAVYVSSRAGAQASPGSAAPGSYDSASSDSPKPDEFGFER
jgi:hypothetical protein